MPSINVPAGYSYVLAAASATPFLNFYQMRNTVSARKAAGVPYPFAYAEKAEVASIDSAAQKFNCAQRAHQNTLEHTPYVLYSLLAAGLKYPYISAVLGTTWVVGRFLFTVGYSTGDPQKRVIPGSLLANVGQFGLYVVAAVTAGQFVVEGL